MGSRTGTLQLVCLPMNSVAMCAPRGRGRCPMTVARSLQIPEDPTRIRRWRAGAKTSLHRCGWLVSQSGGNNRKSVMCEPSTLYRAVWPRPTSVFVQCRPGLHGPRCARLTSILGLSGAAEHAGLLCHVERVMYRSPISAEDLFARSGWPCASESEARSGQFESAWTRRGPRRPRCPVVFSQSYRGHPAAATVRGWSS